MKVRRRQNHQRFFSQRYARPEANSTIPQSYDFSTVTSPKQIQNLAPGPRPRNIATITNNLAHSSFASSGLSTKQPMSKNETLDAHSTMLGDNTRQRTQLKRLL